VRVHCRLHPRMSAVVIVEPGGPARGSRTR
jgi:hypothetical protein